MYFERSSKRLHVFPMPATTGCAFAYLSTNAEVGNALEVVQKPLSNQVTASPALPARVMAARAFRETVNIRVPKPLCSLSSLANAGISIRAALSPPRDLPPA